jgi:hypothetical protein
MEILPRLDAVKQNIAQGSDALLRVLRAASARFRQPQPGNRSEKYELIADADSQCCSPR